MTKNYIQQMTELADSKFYDVEEFKQVSSHPEDTHLIIVRLSGWNHVVYLYNGLDNAFYSGSYHFEEEFAKEAFKRKK